MANTTPKPLTPEQLQQLADLQAQQRAYEMKQAADAAVARREALEIAKPVYDLLYNEQVKAAVAAALEDPRLDFAVKQKIKQVSDSIDYNIGSLSSELNTPLSAPTPTA